MKSVTAYEDSRGGLHPTKAKAAEAEISNILAECPPPPAPPGFVPPHVDVRSIVLLRKKIAALLDWVDAPEFSDEPAGQTAEDVLKKVQS